MNIEKISNCLLANFFLCFLFFCIADLIGISYNFIRIFQIVGFITGVLYLIKTKKQDFDYLIVCYLVYICVNITIVDYKYHGEMVYYAFWTQMVPIFFYFIGRGSKNLSIRNILEKMKWPLLFAIICGIYFFFIPPGWYMNMKMAQIDATTNDYRTLEIFRLSSFWGHPYQIGYATVLYLIFLLYDLMTSGSIGWKKYINYALISLCVMCLLLAQLRVTIAVALIVLIYYICMIKKENIGSLIKTILIASVLITGVSVYVFSFDSEISSYIVEHITMMFEQDNYARRFEHTSGGITDYSFFGGGFGRYSFLARRHDDWALVDQEFQRHIAELGYLGVGLLILILLITFKHCFLRKDLLVEFGVFLFFVVAMIAASVLSNEHQYNFIFWFCVGKIWSTNQSYEKTIVV